MTMPSSGASVDGLADRARHDRQPCLDGEAAREQRGLDVGCGGRQVLQPRQAIVPGVGVDERRDVGQRGPGAVVGDRVAEVRDGAVRVERGQERADALDIASRDAAPRRYC